MQWIAYRLLVEVVQLLTLEVQCSGNITYVLTCHGAPPEHVDAGIQSGKAEKAGKGGRKGAPATGSADVEAPR